MRVVVVLLRLVRCVLFCVMSFATWLRSATSFDARLEGGGGPRTDSSLMVSIAFEGAMDGFWREDKFATRVVRSL